MKTRALEVWRKLPAERQTYAGLWACLQIARVEVTWLRQRGGTKAPENSRARLTECWRELAGVSVEMHTREITKGWGRTPLAATSPIEYRRLVETVPERDRQSLDRTAPFVVTAPVLGWPGVIADRWEGWAAFDSDAALTQACADAFKLASERADERTKQAVSDKIEPFGDAIETAATTFQNVAIAATVVGGVVVLGTIGAIAFAVSRRARR